MQARNLLLRVIKFLGKAIVGLLSALLIILFLLHLPFVQRWITPLLSDYLSEKISARVEIRQLRFSILGDVAIDGLEVWDPGQNKIFDAQEIVVSSDIIDLLSGQLIFDEIRISSVNGHLIQGNNGLNIQFIIEAFQGKKSEQSKEPTPVTLAFYKVSLERIQFQFTSAGGGTDVSVNLGTFNCDGAELLTMPLKIIADKVSLNNTAVNVLTKDQPVVATDTSSSSARTLLSPDFGTGIAFEVGDLEFKNNNFSFHRNEAKKTTKFDPSHIVLDDIEINLAGIVLHSDTLVAALKHLSVKSPGLTILDGGTVARMNRSVFLLSGLHLSTEGSELQAEITGPANLTFESTEDNPSAQMEDEEGRG